MKTLVRSQVLKDTLMFLALLGGALALSTLFADPTLASSLVDPDDNILGGEGDLRTLVKQILNFFLSFLGLVSVVMIIYAGVLYVTSAGNDEKTGQAKKIILYSVIGIIIVFMAFAIVNTVLGAASSGSTVTTTSG